MIEISVRRLSWRPAAVLFVAIGRFAAKLSIFI
jgi:hypothetical protein